MSRLSQEEVQQSPPEQEGEFDNDNHSNSRGYTSIYRKKDSKSYSNRSKIYIALGVLAFVIFFWNYNSTGKSDEVVQFSASEWERDKILDQQVHRLKDAEIQKLEANNHVYQNKIEQSIKEIKRLKDELNKTNSDSNNLDTKEIVSSSLEARKDPPVAEQDRFLVPKFVWLYLNRPATEENYVTQKSIQNKKWYSEQSGFELRTVSKDNYGEWMNAEETTQLDALIKDLQEKKGQSPQLNNKFQKVRQNIIMLHLLNRFGGVVIGKQYIFTEKLEWLQTIKSNILVNIGNPYAKPKVFSFLSITEGTPVSKYNKKASVEVDKYFIAFPGPKDYFIAALAGTEYLTEVLAQYIIIAQNPSAIPDLVAKDKVNCGHMNVNDLNGAFTLASHIVIQRRQTQLNDGQDKFEDVFNKFAIDEYGLFTINSYYFPDKMWFYFTNRLHYFDNFFNYAAKMAQDQFEDSIGPMRYIANPDPHGEFNRRIESARDGAGYTIVEGSFMQRHLFMDKKYDFIQPNRQKRDTAIFKKWDNLPKTLWLYWDSGSENASVTNQLCILSLIKNAKAAGYEVKEVSDANAHQYIPKQTLDRVVSGIANAKMTVRPQTKSDFYRLALISTYGGVYLDSSYYFLEDFTWITEVSKEPTKYFFNRFGDVPKVLMQFHPTQGGPLDWTVDQTYNTKATWHLAFESNFLAADKDSEFVKEWFQMFTFFVASPYDVTEVKMRQCNIVSHKWTNNFDRYLTVMDALKAVLGCKQVDINNNKQKYGAIVHAADYYKLWGFNGFTGIQKFRFYNNYANAYNGMVNEDNLLMYRYSQQYAELVYGRVYKTVKLYGFNIGVMNNLIASQKDNNFTLECHPDSLFLKYLFNKDEHQFYQTNQLHVRVKKI